MNSRDIYESELIKFGEQIDIESEGEGRAKSDPGLGLKGH